MIQLIRMVYTWLFIMDVSLQLHKSLDLDEQIFKLKDSTYFGIKHYKSEHIQLKSKFLHLSNQPFLSSFFELNQTS